MPCCLDLSSLVAPHVGHTPTSGVGDKRPVHLQLLLKRHQVREKLRMLIQCVFQGRTDLVLFEDRRVNRFLGDGIERFWELPLNLICKNKDTFDRAIVAMLDVDKRREKSNLLVGLLLAPRCVWMNDRSEVFDVQGQYVADLGLQCTQSKIEKPEAIVTYSHPI